jgi:uncharacterized protein YndB with AHSA1/START domain
MADFTLRRVIAAPAEVVFETITDHRRYPEFTPIRRAELEREGQPEPNGSGAIRALHVAGPPIREEVLEFERPRRFVYRLLSGLPVRDHVGTVTLLPVDDGTEMAYRIETTPTLPLIGPALVTTLRLAIAALMAGVAREAERRR